MKLLKKITEGEVIAHFLKTEIESVRFRNKILAAVEKFGYTRKLITFPDLSDKEENEIRWRILKEFRTSTFHKFPEDVIWHRASLTKVELEKVKYIDYSYWNELSSGTRLPKVAAKNIQLGLEVFGESNKGFLKAAEHIKRGGSFPAIILVAKDKQSELVILEGHLRMTAYFLAKECLPPELEVIIGFSKNIDKWVY